jgi:hypothetical protein
MSGKFTRMNFFLANPTALRPVRKSAAALMVGASVFALAACGSSGPSSNGEAGKTGTQVSDDAIAALKASGAVHFVGAVSGDSTNTPMTLDLTLEDGGASGEITQSGVKLSLIAVDGVTYSKAPAAFYTAQKITAANAAKVANRWLKLPADSDLSGFNLPSFAKSFSDTDPGVTIDKKVTTSTLNGQPVVVVHQSDGTQLFVAAKGPAYPLKATPPTSGSNKASGAATFTDYGKTVTLKAPPGAVDVTTLIPK